jgi:DNA polymerase-4
VQPGSEAQFLAPMPTKALWGIGPKTSSRLAESGIKTIGDIARLSKEDRLKYLGNYGEELARRSLGIEESVIHTSHKLKSVSNETTYPRDVKDVETLYETLHWLSESVGRRLRKKNLRGNTVKLKLRWHDFTTMTRQVTLPDSTNDDNEIYLWVKDLFNKTWKEGKPIRLLGVGVTHFSEPKKQLSLWDNQKKNGNKLLSAVDSLKERYGRDAIIRGSELKRKLIEKDTSEDNDV